MIPICFQILFYFTTALKWITKWRTNAGSLAVTKAVHEEAFQLQPLTRPTPAEATPATQVSDWREASRDIRQVTPISVLRLRAWLS
jgi:hypothetical protein